MSGGGLVREHDTHTQREREGEREGGEERESVCERERETNIHVPRLCRASTAVSHVSLSLRRGAQARATRCKCLSLRLRPASVVQFRFTGWSATSVSSEGLH